MTSLLIVLLIVLNVLFITTTIVFLKKALMLNEIIKQTETVLVTLTERLRLRHQRFMYFRSLPLLMDDPILREMSIHVGNTHNDLGEILQLLSIDKDVDMFVLHETDDRK